MNRREFLSGLGIFVAGKALGCVIPSKVEAGGKSLLHERKEDGNYIIQVDTFGGNGEPSFYGLAVAQRKVALAVEDQYNPPSGDILSVWNFGDGEVEERNSAQMIHVWNNPGVYDLKVDIYKEGEKLLSLRKQLELFDLATNEGFELEVKDGGSIVKSQQFNDGLIVYLAGKFRLQWWEDFKETRARFYVNDIIKGGSDASQPKGEANWFFEGGALPFSPANPSKELRFRLQSPRDGGARCRVDHFFTLLRRQKWYSVPFPGGA